MLVILGTGATWSRGVLRGFAGAAHEHGWTLLHHQPDANLSWLTDEWAPAAVVFGPGMSRDAVSTFANVPRVSVALDRSAEGIASVCPDEEATGILALDHLLATGLRRFSTFRLSHSPYLIERERAFVARALAAGAKVISGWGSREDQRAENLGAVFQWLREIDKPCGIFTCTDRWGAIVARQARMAGLRVPEDLALVGADNDSLECDLIAPPLSSVMIPWQRVGQSAADLVRRALAGTPIAGKLCVIDPIAVVRRRSSDLFAADDALVTSALGWIRSNAGRRISVDMVARALGGGRQRLERRFRAALQRTVHDEIRRAHVDIAKSLLETTRLSLAEVAEQSGFSTASLLSVAFRQEMGSAPGLYRRRVQQELASLTPGSGPKGSGA